MNDDENPPHYCTSKIFPIPIMLAVNQILFACLLTSSVALGFAPSRHSVRVVSSLHSTSEEITTSTSSLYVPADQKETYGNDIAQYLVDLHDSKATFNFCGG